MTARHPRRDRAASPRLPSPALLSLAALLAAAGGCGTGQQVAAGPVFGYVVQRGWSAGWELGGGPITMEAGTNSSPSVDSLIMCAAVGMSWRPGPAGTGERERLIYAAWEPWFLAGGTFGAARSSASGEFLPMIGWWEAVPFLFGGFQRTVQAVPCSPCYTLSLGFGWRWGGSGIGEYFVSPKLGLLNGISRPWPFRDYAD